MADQPSDSGWLRDWIDRLSATGGSVSCGTVIAWGTVGIAGIIFLLTIAITFQLVPVQPTIVTSDSMEPTYSTGDIVFIDESEPVTVGDPILFTTDEGLILHRAVDRQADNTYLTRGDAVSVQDQGAGRAAVSPGQIVGPVAHIGPVDAVIPQLGTVFRWNLGTRLALAAAVMLTAVAGQLGTDGLRQRGYSVSRETILSLVPFSAYLGLVGAVYATVTSTVHEYTVTSSSTAAGSVISVGAETSREVVVGQTWLGPTGYTVARSETARVTAISTETAARRIQMDLPVQSSPGSLSVELTVGTYPHVLPGGVIEFLHGIHPGVAAITTTFVIGAIVIGCVQASRHANSRLR